MAVNRGQVIETSHCNESWPLLGYELAKTPWTSSKDMDTADWWWNNNQLETGVEECSGTWTLWRVVATDHCCLSSIRHDDDDDDESWTQHKDMLDCLRLFIHVILEPYSVLDKKTESQMWKSWQTPAIWGRFMQKYDNHRTTNIYVEWWNLHKHSKHITTLGKLLTPMCLCHTSTANTLLLYFNLRIFQTPKFVNTKMCTCDYECHVSRHAKFG